MKLLKQLLHSLIDVLPRKTGKHRIGSRQNRIAPIGLIGLLLIPVFSHGEALKVISVEESRPGRVTATLGLPTSEPLNPLDFWLEFDGKDAVQAKKVEPIPSIRPERSIILIIDQGSAMPPLAVKRVREALKELAAGPPLPASIAVWAFDSQVKKIHGFSNVSGLATDSDQIGDVADHGGKTRLYEAIGLALSELRSHPAKGPKRLLVITAGRDDNSSISEQAVTSGSNADDIPIDAIALGDVSHASSALLARLAKDTKGHYIRPDASELAHSLRTFLDPVPSHGVQVFFQYEPVSEGQKAKSVQLEFVRNGKHIVLPVQGELVLPKEGPLGGGLPYQPAIGQENVKDLMLIWISVGLAGVVAAYAAGRISRRKRANGAPDEPKPPEPNGDL
jgi:hypothetical protein